ncbi:oligosaccharide flippase family protein [Mycobacterium deserti]|uniref:Oligosaccharide flippase family protein n=1 Tax=Mycobacterium deserti TaxID=2978347 RepID=A0ABT2MF24_9MYCO|nr:oligosaccharide flippase family protein [Mycobacterium deserti]MCT7660159.1 oligosaccharide flippase family protein [Mycobacterium deserti]
MTDSTMTAPGPVSTSRIAHAFSVQLVCRIVGMVASVVSVAMTARYLGPNLYGQLTIAVVFIGMWTSLADLGINTVIVRRVTSGRGQLERLVKVNSGLSVVYCVPLAALAAGTGLLIYPDADVKAMLVVMSAQLLMMTMTARFEPVFLTSVRFTAVALSDVVSRLAMLGCIVSLVHTEQNILWFAAAQLIPPALQLLVQGVAASRHISLRPVFSPTEAADLLRESLAPMGVIVIAILYWRADGVILSLLSSHSEVGVYGLAYTIAFNMVIFSTFFLKSTLSTATDLFARDVPAFTAFMQRSVETMYFLGIPVAAVGVLLAGPLIGLLGDDQFVERGAPTLALLFIAVALRFVTGTLGQGLLASHQQRFLFQLSIWTLAINVALNVVLAISFGAVGAAAALVFTEVFGMVFASVRLRECGYRTPFGFLLRTLGPVAMTVMVVIVLRHHHVLVAGTVAIATYLAGNLALGPVRMSTLSALRRGNENEDA